MNAALAPTGLVLLDQHGHMRRAYVEVLDDGRVRAGTITIETYDSVEACYAYFRHYHAGVLTQASEAIVAALEGYMMQKDDGR